MEDYFEGFSEEITKWDIIKELLDLDIDDSGESKQSNPGVQLLPRQDVMLYGTIPKMEQKIYSKCKECRLVFNPRDILSHKNCSGKSYTAQQNLLKKKVKSKGSSSKKPHSSSVPPPPLFKKPSSPPISASSNVPVTTSSQSIVLPELKVSVTKVVMHKIPKLTTVTSTIAPTCTSSSRTSDITKSSFSSHSKQHSSHSPLKTSSHHNPKSGHSHYLKSSHHHESSRHSHSSHGSHSHHSHSHSSKSSLKTTAEASTSHLPSSSKSRHKKSRKNTPSSTASTSVKPTVTSSTTACANLEVKDLNSEDPCVIIGTNRGTRSSLGSSAHRPVQHLRKVVPPCRNELGGRKEEKEIFCQNTSYVPIVTKIVNTIETATPLTASYIRPKVAAHSKQLSTSVLASKKSNVMESETLKNGFITQNLDNIQDNNCVNVPIVFMPMSPISVVNPAAQFVKIGNNMLFLDSPQSSLQTSLLRPKPFFLPIPSNHTNIQIYKSHPKPVVMPTFGTRKIGGTIMMKNPHIERQRTELLDLLNVKKKTLSNNRTVSLLNHSNVPHRPNILKSKSISKNNCKRSASDRPNTSDSKQMRLISDVNGFILHADVSEAPEVPRPNNCIQEKIALLNMK